MPSSDSLPDFTGQLVDGGRLQLLKVLGSGSYGVVYKALDTSSPSDSPSYYAVKCLGSGTATTTRDRAPQRLLGAPVHHHLPPPVLHRDWLFIVLELSDCDLWTAIDNGVFYHDNALLKQTFLKLLDAVRFCHQRGVHHRDLKPENILCNADGSNIRIADFGLAIDDELPCATAAGTLSYMTPESLTLRRGKSYEPEQSDVWACCIILLNMMMGRFPWRKAVETDDGWHEFLTNAKYLRREFPISDQLDELLERCFRPVSATRPSLLQLRFEIANTKNLIKVVQPDPIDTQLLAVPLPNGPSAPPTPGASFSFNVSDYPSPATSNATSVFVDINSVRLSVLPQLATIRNQRLRRSAPAT
ncbi:kinase-like domain-containing protein [Mycena leptocephala]|nr:kinase-like domain-containing protein [Mycena leptocephala]